MIEIATRNVPVGPHITYNVCGDYTHLIQACTREDRPYDMTESRRVINYFLLDKSGGWDRISPDVAAEIALNQIFADVAKSMPVKSEPIAAS